jgi:hypothetical protein
LVADVVWLNDLRKRERPGSAHAPAAEAPRSYYCTRCHAGQFRLLASGHIHCAHCGALMRNIAVADTGREQFDNR